MTSFHLLPPYHQPLCIRRLAARMLQATYLQKATHAAVASTDDNHALNWSSINSNVIATVLGSIAVAAVGSVFYIAIQVPRQQSEILANQAEAQKSLQSLIIRMDRIEANDRRQDERIIRQEHR